LQPIHFYLKSPSTLSTDPVDSDLLSNQTLVKHLVGTLIRYKSAGIFEPYIASSWRVENQCRIIFEISKGLVCENNEPINAQTYKHSLNRLLKIYAKSSDLPIFEKLEGWAQFKKGESKELRGLQVNANQELEFQFTSPVNEGFFEYLSMPYFGFYCNENFNKDSFWKDSRRIISSGPYRLTELNEMNSRAHLSLRKNWSLNSEQAPNEVIYHWNYDIKQVEPKFSVIQMTHESENGPQTMTPILGAPDIFFSIVLDINQNSPFKNFDLRKSFQKIFTEEKKALAKTLTATNSKMTETLFIDQKVPAKDQLGKLSRENQSAKNQKLQTEIDRPLRVLVRDTESASYLALISLTEKILQKMALEYEILKIGQHPNANTIDIRDREKYDIRLASVYSGATFDPWVVELMFCSNLGISFPDPSGRICKEIKSFLKGETASTKKDVSDHLAQILFDDAAVLPAYHTSNVFYFSPELDLKSISPDMIAISFEDLRIRK
jgi:ABC-type oligopeptide transport system substrate-binding subunit